MASTKATRVGEELVVVTPFFSMCIFQHDIGSGSKLMFQCARHALRKQTCLSSAKPDGPPEIESTKSTPNSSL